MRTVYLSIADRASRVPHIRDAIARKMQAAEPELGIPSHDWRPSQWARQQVLEELIDALAYLAMTELHSSDLSLLIHQMVLEFWSPEELAQLCPQELSDHDSEEPPEQPL